MKATQLPNGLYEVESETSDQTYIISLETPACSCKHFTYRLAGTGTDCKHLTAARALAAQEKIKQRFTTATRVPDALLPVLLERHADDPAIATALLYERERRRQRDEANEKMLAIFR